MTDPIKRLRVYFNEGSLDVECESFRDEGSGWFYARNSADELVGMFDRNKIIGWAWLT